MLLVKSIHQAVFTNLIARMQFLTNQEAQCRQLLLLHKKRLIQGRVSAVAIDLFDFTGGRLLLERHELCDLQARKTSFFVVAVSFSMFRL